MTDPNDTAFPIFGDELVTMGLTKREYFAAMAMQGILSGIGFFADSKIRGPDGEMVNPSMAKIAIESADALIAELNKP